MTFAYHCKRVVGSTFYGEIWKKKSYINYKACDSIPNPPTGTILNTLLQIHETGHEIAPTTGANEAKFSSLSTKSWKLVAKLATTRMLPFMGHSKLFPRISTRKFVENVLDLRNLSRWIWSGRFPRRRSDHKRYLERFATRDEPSKWFVFYP